MQENRLPLHLLNENESDIPEDTPVKSDMEEGVPDSDALKEHLKSIQEVKVIEKQCREY